MYHLISLSGKTDISILVKGSFVAAIKRARRAYPGTEVVNTIASADREWLEGKYGFDGMPIIEAQGA
jgi:hypothetical protein